MLIASLRYAASPSAAACSSIWIRLCLKTLSPHDDSEWLWPLGVLARAGSVDPSSRDNDADEAILGRLRWAGFDPSASLPPLDGSTEPDFGATPRGPNRIRPIVSIQGLQTEPRIAGG
jgi:hypothetical protein